MKVMQLLVYSHPKPYDIFVIYRPPPSSANRLSVTLFKEELSILLESSVISDRQLLLVGDFNVHVDNSTNNMGSFFLDILTYFGLTQHINKPTHNHGHILDLVITRDQQSIAMLPVVNPAISDHNLVMFELKTHKPEKESKTVYFRKFKSLDIDKFCSLIRNSILYKTQSDDPEYLADLYNSTITGIIEKLLPLKAKVTKVREPVPWFNSEIGELRRIRRSCERKWRKTKTELDFKSFCSAKNKVCKAIFDAKKQHYTAAIKNTHGDQKQLFTIMNQLLNKEKVTKLPSGNDDYLAQKFNDFFISKIDKIQEHLSSQQTGLDPHIHDKEAHSTLLNFRLTTEEEVSSTVMSRPNKQCVLDPVPTAILKQCVDTFSPILTKIINASLTKGVVPSQFKHSVVTPLLKKSTLNSEEYKNYRPVSNLPFINLEKIVSIRLDEYKNEFKYREPMQSAYRSHHSTETAIVKICNDLLLAADRGECSILVLLDLSAAFDTVNHQILLRRLENQFGIKGTAIQWMTSYLKNRVQKVKIKQSTSSEAVLNLNVPQGSILGPGEYSDFTEPIGDIVRKNHVIPHFYADDSQLYKHFIANYFELCAVMLAIKTCTIDVKQWMTSNYLMLNDNKTEAILFGTKTQLEKCSMIDSIKVGDSDIKIQTCVKNIGVYLDSELKMTQQVNSITSSAWFQLRNISKIRRYLTTEATLTIVHAFITSKLDLYNSILYGCPASLLDKLQKVQNAAARLILGGNKFDHATPLLNKLNWLPIPRRIEYKIILLTFKSLHGLAPGYLSDLLKIYNPPRQLRSKNKMLLEVPKTVLKTYGDKAFAYAAPTLWNSLPEELRTTSSIELFKRHLKTHLFKKH